jgi:ATP-dependent Clp protease ATP-binding subunit ClpA
MRFLRSVLNTNRLRRHIETDRSEELPADIEQDLAARVVGQPEAVAAIVPYVRMYQACLAPEGRPAGVFLLLGPSGTGKTRTVEALASILHGSEKSVLKVDCGEFQLDHEVAKLIGAPPGYLGHRETQPLLSQAKLNAVTSDRSSLAIVLFDEIEKAAPSMTRLLLGVLDKAALRLGDNNTVNFERTLIFLTSNLGAREMARAVRPGFGFEALAARSNHGSGIPGIDQRLDRIGQNAVRRKFPPEFVNRIDAVVTYRPLANQSLEAILDMNLDDFRRLVHSRLGPAAFDIQVAADARRFLLDRGVSPEYGARELKRTLHRHLIQPLAARVAQGTIPPGATVVVSAGGDSLAFHVEAPNQRRRRLTLIGDD